MRFFVVPALDPEGAEAEVNAFLAQHRIASIDRELVAHSNRAFWLLAVTYVESGSSPSAAPVRRDKTDYKQVLAADDFQVFAELRRLRKEMAERDGVPLYVLFSNKQLATMARERTTSLEALRRIEGVGEARTEKYGEAFLAAIARSSVGKTDPTEGDA